MNKVAKYFSKKENLFYIFFFLLFLTILISFLYKGFYSRFLQDDYCYGAFIKQSGFWNTQLLSYISGAAYNGNRYSLTLFSGIAEILGGSSIIPWLPAFWIMTWLLALSFLFYTISLVVFKKNKIFQAILFSEIILTFTFYLAPELFQVLYWKSGSLPYLASLVFNTYLLARFFQLSPLKIKSHHYVEFGILSLLAAGFSETVAVVQVTFWGIVFLLCLFRKRATLGFRKQYLLLIILIGFSICGVLLLALSPSNSSMLQVRPAKPITFITFLTLSFRFGLDILVDSIKSKWLPFGVLFILGFVLSFYSKIALSTKRIAFHIGILGIGLFLLSVASSTPSVFLGSVYPENRALFPIHYIIVLSVFFSGILFSQILKNWFVNHNLLKFLQKINYLFILFLMVYLIRMIPIVYAGITPLQSRAIAWDQRQAWIYQEIAAGKMQVTVSAFDSIARLTELKEDPLNWVNMCAADYYGVDSISAVEYYNDVKPYFR
jgi:hypothetical protein